MNMGKGRVVVISTITIATAAAALVWREKVRKKRQLLRAMKIVRTLAAECATPVPRLWEVVDALVADIKAVTSTIRLDVTYASRLPNGEEEGRRYGINLGATKFTMLCGMLNGKDNGISELQREEISLPSNVVRGTSQCIMGFTFEFQELFDYMAAELAKFVSANPMNDAKVSSDGGHHDAETRLGLTVSYRAVDQATDDTTGSAIRWKSFATCDTVQFLLNHAGRALVEDFNQTLNKHGLKMRASTIVEENVGNLACGRYKDKDTVAAVTFGLATNAAFVDTKDGSASPASEEQVISMEWNDFKSSSLPITEYDASLDAESPNPGSQVFEKLVSEVYLPEIVRKVVLKMAQETALFGRSTVPLKLSTPYILRSPEMAAMHQDTSEGREVVGQKLKQVFGIRSSSRMARQMVAEVCEVVVQRGARLAGAGIVSIIKNQGRTEYKRSVVVVGGGLYEHYRLFRNILHGSICEMLGDEHRNNIVIQNSPHTGPLFL